MQTQQRGLTLIELLVVIAILALASSVVLLNAPPSRPAVREDAERFAARLQLALDEAIAAGAVMRIRVDALGYEFEMLQAGEWRAIENDRLLGGAVFDEATTALVEIADPANDNARALGVDERADEAKDKSIRIILDPLGAQTAFVARFSSSQGAWRVVLSDTGAVSVAQDG